jgi:hypothetical protein
MRTNIAFIALFLISACGAAGAQTASFAARPAPLADEAPVSVFSAPTVSGFLAACKADQGGCIDEVGSALMDKFQFRGDICLPSINYADAVPGWLDSHNQTHAMATEDGIYLALKSLYPCD